VREAARADWTRAPRSHLDPLRVLPEPCLPAESRCPGRIPAHDARWAAVGKTDMSGPISARMTWAERWSIPGIVAELKIVLVWTHCLVGVSRTRVVCGHWVGPAVGVPTFTAA